MGFASRLAWLNEISAKEYAEIWYLSRLEPIGYDRNDYATAVTAGVPLGQLQFTHQQTDDEIARLVEAQF